MAATNILKSAAASLTGGIEKAILEITDERGMAEAKKIQIGVPKARTAGISGIGPVSSKVNEAASKAAKSAEALTKSVGMAGMADAMKTGIPFEHAKKKRFEVKFNPNQISFQGIGGGRIAKTNFAAGGDVDMKYQKMNPRIQMNIQLIFDDYERTEAFMLEKFSDPTAMVRTGVTGTISAVTGKKRSVQHQVEGLIGALRNDSTRKIAFYWGMMKYQGVMTHVSAEYTMFSTDGVPIRANVNLGMLLTDDTMTDNYMGQWRESYQKVFEKDGITNAGSVMQNAGNLLNINL